MWGVGVDGPGVAAAVDFGRLGAGPAVLAVDLSGVWLLLGAVNQEDFAILRRRLRRSLGLTHRSGCRKLHRHGA